VVGSGAAGEPGVVGGERRRDLGRDDGAANDVPLQMANPELKSSRSIVRRSPTTTVGQRPPCSAVGTVLTIAAPGRWVVTHGPSLVNSATEVLSGLRAPTLTIGGGPESGTAAPRGSASAAG